MVQPPFKPVAALSLLATPAATGNDVKSNDLWLGSMAMSGFNAAAYFATHPRPLAAHSRQR